MRKISQLGEFGKAERIVFADQDVETEWAYLRLEYDNSPYKKCSWLQARGADSRSKYGFDLILDDRELETAYQAHLKDLKEQQQ